MKQPRTMRILVCLLFALGALVAFPAAAQESTPEMTPESTPDFAPAQTIPPEELGDYATGVRFSYGGRTWEFVSDIPGIAYTADMTDVAFLSDTLDRLMHANNPEASALEAPDITTIRVAFDHENEFSVPLSINNQYGITAAQVAAPGVVLLRTPYNDTFVRGLHVDGTTETMRVAFLHSVIFSQIYYASRIGLADVPGDDYYRSFLSDLGLPEIPDEDRVWTTFRGLGMQFDPAVFAAETAITSPTEPTAEPAQQEARTGTFNRTGNLRQGSSTNSASVASVRQGTPVTILSEERGQVVVSYGITSTLWYRVRVDETGQEGYAWSGLVDVNTP